MGKVRSKKCSKVARVDPTGLSKLELEEEEEDCQELGPVSVFVQTLLEQLQSHLAEDRDSGLNSLSVGCSRKAYLEEILASDIFKVVGPLLLDPSVSVRHSAAGALRNLSSLNMEICEKMVAADVMTPLVATLKQKYPTDWLPQSKEKRSKQPLKIDSSTEALVEMITLLTNLCESGESAVKVVNRENLVAVISRFLNTEAYGVRLALTTALCVFSATEDNVAGISNKAEIEDYLKKIFLLKEETPGAWQILHLQTTAIGILVNLYKGDLRQTKPETICLVMKIINSTLDVDHLREVNKFSSEIPLKNGQHEEVYHRQTESDLSKVFELDDKFENIMALVSSQVLSLEILSNIIVSDDGVEHEDDDDEESVEDFNGDEDSMAVEDDVEMQDICSSDIPTEVYESLSSAGTVLKVLNKVKSLPVNVKNILNEDDIKGQHLARKCDILRSTALICLQNVLDVCSLADLEKCITIIELWTGLGQVLSECETSDEMLVEAITSAMRAVVQTISSQKTIHPAFGELCGGFKIFHQVYSTVDVKKVKVNIIKIVGCIGLILSRFPKDTPVPNNLNIVTVLTEIAEYLLNCLSTIKLEREGIWIAAEILDTFFDVFAEDDYNQVLQKVALIQKLKSLQPSFKKQVRNERRSLGEHAAVIQTANTNLPRFIQYKEKHGAC